MTENLLNAFETENKFIELKKSIVATQWIHQVVMDVFVLINK